MNVKEFLSSLPEKIKQGDNEGVSTNLHFDFDQEQYTLSVENGEGKVQDGLIGEAEVVLKASSADFIDIIKGDLNPMSAMMFGKLKVSNPAAMMKYAKLLGIM